jgi:hypothetical protein
MNGKLRLDLLANLIEGFLHKHADEASTKIDAIAASPSVESESLHLFNDPLYVQTEVDQTIVHSTTKSLSQEIESAIRFTDFLGSSVSSPMIHIPRLPHIERGSPVKSQITHLPAVSLSMRTNRKVEHLESEHLVHGAAAFPSVISVEPKVQRRLLVNRRATHDLDSVADKVAIDSPGKPRLDYVTVPSTGRAVDTMVSRAVPLIPFEDLMLIEALGTGRVSTIYRAAWQHSNDSGAERNVQMVALKVAMMTNLTGDGSHINELRNEADIAARLQHPNVCDLVGVAADPECFVLAYEFCDGGSLLSLLSDHSRYYEYLPIAMDIANGMAYLHSLNIIHRDLKPSVCTMLTIFLRADLILTDWRFA